MSGSLESLLSYLDIPSFLRKRPVCLTVPHTIDFLHEASPTPRQ